MAQDEGIILWHLGKRGEALALYRELARSGRPEAILLLARRLQQAGLLPEADRAFRRLASVARRVGRVVMASYADRQRDPTAGPPVDIFVTEVTLLSGMRGDVGTAIRRLQDYERWLEVHESFLELAEARSARALLLAQAGKLDEGIRLATTAADRLGAYGWVRAAVVAALGGEPEVAVRAAMVAMRKARLAGDSTEWRRARKLVTDLKHNVRVDRDYLAEFLGFARLSGTTAIERTTKGTLAPDAPSR